LVDEIKDDIPELSNPSKNILKKTVSIDYD